MMRRRIVLALVIIACCTPLAFAADSYKVVVLGDSRGGDNGLNLAMLQELVSAIISEGPDVVLFTGDLVDMGTLDQLRYWIQVFMDPLQQAGIRVYPCRGNHDTNSGDAPWQAAFSGNYLLPQDGPPGEENVTYSVAYKNALFIALDQYVTLSKVNQPWLSEKLRTNPYPHAFVFGHTPAFSVNHPDCLAIYPQNRDAMWNSLAAGGARVYFCGHDHFYNHAKVQDANNVWIHQMVAGTAGAPLYSWSGTYADPRVVGILHSATNGYSVININGLDVQITYKARLAPNVYVALDDVFHYTGRIVGAGVPAVGYIGIALGIAGIVGAFLILSFRFRILDSFLFRRHAVRTIQNLKSKI